MVRRQMLFAAVGGISMWTTKCQGCIIIVYVIKPPLLIWVQQYASRTTVHAMNKLLAHLNFHCDAIEGNVLIGAYCLSGQLDEIDINSFRVCATQNSA